MSYEGICASTLIASGSRRLAAAEKRSKSLVLEQSVLEHKVFQCCMHKWDAMREERVVRLHAEAMQRYADSTKTFITLDGWKSIQHEFSKQDRHLVGLSHLQMIYHHNLRCKAGTDGNYAETKATLDGLVLYTRWDEKLDQFLLGHYHELMKIPLVNGQKKKFLTVQEWEQLQREFEFWQRCCPTMRQLQGRVNELLRWNYMVYS